MSSWLDKGMVTFFSCVPDAPFTARPVPQNLYRDWFDSFDPSRGFGSVSRVGDLIIQILVLPLAGVIVSQPF